VAPSQTPVSGGSVRVMIHRPLPCDVAGRALVGIEQWRGRGEWIVSLDATDVPWVRTAGGEGVQRAQVFALPDTGSVIVGLTSHAHDRAPQIQFGDVSLVGYGLAILDMNRP